MKVMPYTVQGQVQKVLMQFYVFLPAVWAKFIRNGGAAVQAVCFGAVVFLHNASVLPLQRGNW